MSNIECKKDIISDGLSETKCIFCENAEDKVVYPQRISNSSFTGYAYSARRKRKREHYRTVACKSCSLVRANPVIKEDVQNELYSESQFIFSEEERFVAKTYANLLKKICVEYSADIKSLMEVGCSTGFFLKQAMDMGIEDVVGFEPSNDCVSHAVEEIKEKIIADKYDPSLMPDKFFDLVCSFHVFDHLRHPSEVLDNMVEKLNPGGHVLLVCHDVESWSAKLLRSFSPIFDIEHIYLFSKKTLRMLLENSGIEVLEVGSLENTYPLAYWMRMTPVLNKIVGILPKFIQEIPVTLKPGNLYIIGRKGKKIAYR